MLSLDILSPMNYLTYRVTISPPLLKYVCMCVCFKATQCHAQSYYLTFWSLCLHGSETPSLSSLTAAFDITPLECPLTPKSSLRQTWSVKEVGHVISVRMHGIVGLNGCDHCWGEQFLLRAGRKAEKVEEQLKTLAGWTVCSYFSHQQW